MKLSFKYEIEVKTFKNKKLSEFLPGLEEILKFFRLKENDIRWKLACTDMRWARNDSVVRKY